MEKIGNIKTKLMVALTILVIVFNMSINSYAVKIYTSKLEKGDKLEFKGTAWCVYKSKKIAQKVGNGERPIVKRYIKKGEKFKILEIDKNVVKIAKNQYIYYGSTAKKYFKKVDQKNKAENTIVENTIAENTIAENTIAENTIAENTIAENTIVENTIAENTIAENTIAENIIAENTIVENTIAENTIAENIIAENTITEEKIAINNLKLDKTELNLYVGKDATIKVTIDPSNAAKKDLEWKSSDESIAIVDSNGKVTAKKEGTAMITVRALDGSETTSICNVNVKAVKVTKIELNKSEITLKVGKTATLKTTKIYPNNATNKGITWSSSDEKIATVDEKGKVKAIKKGNVTITATAKDGSNTKANCIVTIVQPVTGITMSPKKVTLTEGKYKTLKAIIAPSNASNKNIKWESSNSKVATVNQNGKVKAIKEGKATITATAKDGSGIKAKCIVKVNKKEKKVTTKTKEENKEKSVTEEEKKVTKINLYRGYKIVTGTTITVNLSSKGTRLEAEVLPNGVLNRSVTWISTNKNVATVNNGHVTFINTGTTAIIAKAKDGSNISALVYIKIS